MDFALLWTVPADIVKLRSAKTDRLQIRGTVSLTDRIMSSSAGVCPTSSTASNLCHGVSAGHRLVGVCRPSWVCFGHSRLGMSCSCLCRLRCPIRPCRKCHRLLFHCFQYRYTQEAPRLLQELRQQQAKVLVLKLMSLPVPKLMPPQGLMRVLVQVQVQVLNLMPLLMFFVPMKYHVSNWGLHNLSCKD